MNSTDTTAISWLHFKYGLDGPLPFFYQLLLGRKLWEHMAWCSQDFTLTARTQSGYQ